ncbi:MAG: endonuclease/exonuclease/phosphatase family protein [Oscillospiraceae bacterium]|nr:endonuclease/exonuclease/phosphatase family protein [Oscillospiraceae bacterium]
MRLATYNIWNETKGRGNRINQIVNEIASVNADIIGLQEVTEPTFNILTERLGYKYHTFAMYYDEDEGLAFFSKFPIDEVFFLNESAEYANSRALHALINADGSSFSTINLHLPWDSILEKEKQIVAIYKYNQYANSKKDGVSQIIMGDFNCALTSSVHNYLIGEQSLSGREVNPYWDDLASNYAAINGLPNKATLDFQKNPRWRDNTTETPVIYDRIYVAGVSNIKNVDIFGTAISPETGLSASDHYGVFADVEF